MSDAQLHILATTFPERELAERVARSLVDAGLAVCAQVGADTVSFYQWEGAVRQDAEVSVVFKVLGTRFELFVGELKLLHPYEIPQLVAWRADWVDKNYLNWAQGGS